MFDTNNYSSKEYVPYTKTVHEHRAPTDESIKIFDEMRRKAEEHIVAKVIIKDNTVNGMLLAFDEGGMMDNIRYYGRFTLNGKEINFNGTLDRDEFQKLGVTIDGNELLIPILHKQFEKAMADVLMTQVCYNAANEKSSVMVGGKCMPKQFELKNANPGLGKALRPNNER